MKKINELYFENIGENFNDWISPYDLDRRTILIKSLLPLDASYKSCLEIGCGTGRISERMAPFFSDYCVSDVSEKLARETGERLGKKWLCLNTSKLEVANSAFDVVLSSECIEHTEDPWISLEEMIRVLRPGGTLLFTTPNRLWFPLLWVAMKLRIRKFQGPERWIFPLHVVDWLKKRGFKDVVVSGCHLMPWQLPWAKGWLPFFDQWGRRLFPLMVNFGICAKKPL